jgi:hypothetical protein
MKQIWAVNGFAECRTLSACGGDQSRGVMRIVLSALLVLLLSVVGGVASERKVFARVGGVSPNADLFIDLKKHPMSVRRPHKAGFLGIWFSQDVACFAFGKPHEVKKDEIRLRVRHSLHVPLSLEAAVWAAFTSAPYVRLQVGRASKEAGSTCIVKAITLARTLGSGFLLEPISFAKFEKKHGRMLK